MSTSSILLMSSFDSRDTYVKHFINKFFRYKFYKHKYLYPRDYSGFQFYARDTYVEHFINKFYKHKYLCPRDYSGFKFHSEDTYVEHFVNKFFRYKFYKHKYLCPRDYSGFKFHSGDTYVEHFINEFFRHKFHEHIYSSFNNTPAGNFVDFGHSTVGPVFSCDVNGYLIQQRALYRIELTTGKSTLIKNGIGPGGVINGAGYNRFDDFIYGMHQDVGGGTGSQLVRIAANGAYEMLPARISNSKSIVAGDIDNQGRFWISEFGHKWWQIDLRPGSATFGKIVQSGTAALANNIADWSYVPGGGDYLYALAYTYKSTTLVRFSRTSKTWETLRAFGNLSGQNLWGALYSAKNGVMYGSENTGGEIWQFPIAPSIGTPSKLSSGPTSSQNDGARCIDSEELSV
ncbi:Fc.00g031830.m01.CDS01 [Cosmosporella sp. VM-42]